jgi:hypothetical protein
MVEEEEAQDGTRCLREGKWPETVDGSDSLIMSCQRAAALCNCVMAAKAPLPGVLRPNRRGNLPLHILCDKDGVMEEEVGVLLREAPHTSACPRRGRAPSPRPSLLKLLLFRRLPDTGRGVPTRADLP